MSISVRFPIAIIAGGMGTRIATIANHLPKSLIPIHGEPFITHQLRLLASNGFTDVVMCVGYQADQIIDVVKEGQPFNVKVRYSHDGENLLGTGGSIANALPLLGEQFFVMYGDSFLQCDYETIQKTYENSKKLGLMTVYKNNNQWDTSNVEFNGVSIVRYSKIHLTPAMQHIDYGLSIFSRAAFTPFQDHVKFDLSLVQENLVHENQLAAFEVPQRFYEIGSVSGIQELGRYLNNKDSKQ